MSIRDLLETAKVAQAAAARGNRSSSNAWTNSELCKITLVEAAEGKLVGPMTKEQLDEKFGALWVPTRRFGVRQGTRPMTEEEQARAGDQAIPVAVSGEVPKVSQAARPQ